MFQIIDFIYSKQYPWNICNLLNINYINILVYGKLNFSVQERKQYFVSWGRKIIKVFENPIQYLRKPYYLKIKFRSDFYITEVTTNHPELQKFKIENIFPKTLYRVIDYNKHFSLLNLIYQLKFEAPERTHNIHLLLNSSKILTRGMLKIIIPEKKYSLKLKISSLDNSQVILDQYQHISTHNKEMGYQLYDDIQKINLQQVKEISELTMKYSFSQSSLSRIFNNVIGICPSTVLMERRLIAFKQHLLREQVYISEIYWQYGFKSLRSLNRNFKKFFGITPVEFRRKYKNHQFR